MVIETVELTRDAYERLLAELEALREERRWLRDLVLGLVRDPIRDAYFDHPDEFVGPI